VDKVALPLTSLTDASRARLPYNFPYTLKMEAIRSSETSVNTISTRCHIPEDCFLLKLSCCLSVCRRALNSLRTVMNLMGSNNRQDAVNTITLRLESGCYRGVAAVSDYSPIPVFTEQ
jgi:hypothetical protein